MLTKNDIIDALNDGWLLTFNTSFNSNRWRLEKDDGIIVPISEAAVQALRKDGWIECVEFNHPVSKYGLKKKTTEEPK